MNKKVVLLLVLILLFAGFIGVKYFILDNRETYGQLKIMSSPATNIFIDNVALSKTPLEEKYKTGEYMVKLIPDKTATDTASWQGKIKVYKNALTFVNRELGSTDITSAGEIFTTTKMDKKPKNVNNGAVFVETEPQGAITYLDNDEKGVAPLILEEVPAGDHELSVYMPGFFKRTQKINVDAGYQVNASFKLAIDQNQKQQPTGTPDDNKVSTPGAKTTKNTIIIKDTPTGFLRVRSEASVNGDEVGRVNPGDKFPMLDEQSGWYKIEYEKGKEGWVSAQYADKQ